MLDNNLVGAVLGTAIFCTLLIRLLILENRLKGQATENQNLKGQIVNLMTTNESLQKIIDLNKRDVSFIIESKVEELNGFFKNSQKIKIYQRICIDKIPTPVSWEVYSQELSEVKEENVKLAIERVAKTLQELGIKTFIAAN
ncbi:MAG: hypothetical protein ACXWR0_05150 [Bdellovibrio sp.]